MPEIGDRHDALVGGDLDLLPDLQVLVVGELLVDRDACRRSGGPPLVNWEFEKGSVTYENTRLGAPPLTGHVLAVDHDRAGGLDLALGLLDAVDAGLAVAITDSGSGPGHRAVVRREGGLLGEHHVDALVALVEDARERVVDLVAEDEGAGDHRRAEHDRERRQHRAQLAAPQPAEGDLHHSALTSAIAASTSAGSERPWSRTIWPSARNSTPVGHRRGVGVMGDHHRGLPVGRHHLAQQRSGSRRWSASRGCRSARRRTSRSAATPARGRSRPAAAGRRRARTGGACGGRPARPCR